MCVLGRTKENTTAVYTPVVKVGATAAQHSVGFQDGIGVQAESPVWTVPFPQSEGRVVHAGAPPAARAVAQANEI